MSDVLVSIRHEWCEEIFSGRKKWEIRKTAPKCETPFRANVYESKAKALMFADSGSRAPIVGSGQVIGSFVCDSICKILPCADYYTDGYEIDDDMLAATRLSRAQLTEYGRGKTLYAWHVSCPRLFTAPQFVDTFGKKEPPQSWCYLEDSCISKESTESRALTIAASLMERAGLCTRTPQTCRKLFADRETCQECIRQFLIKKAMRELEAER